MLKVGSTGLIAATAGCNGNGDDGGAGGGDDGGVAGGDGEGAIKIGMLVPLSGPVAGAGESYLNGLEVGVDALNENDGINGMDVEVVERDSEANPETAVNSAQALITEESVDVIMGIGTTPVANAVVPIAAENEVPVIVMGAANVSLTRDDCNEYMFRTNTTQNAFEGALAHGVADLTDSSMTRVAGINPDYGTGRAAWEIFSNTLAERRDIEIVNKEWPAFGAGEYEREIRATLDAEPDIVHNAMFSGSKIAFVQQANQFDFFDKIGAFTLNSPIEVSMALGDDTPESISKAPADFRWPPDNQQREDFVNKYEGEIGQVPLQYALYSRGSLTALKEGIEESGGKSADDIITGLEGLEFSSVLTDIEIRAEDHQALYSNVLTGRIRPIDGYDHYGFTDFNPIDGRELTHDVQCTV